MNVVAEYCKYIGYSKSPEEYMKQNKKFIVEVNGRQEMSGAAMNVVKDKIFEGRILDLVEKTIEFVRGQIKEHTYLDPDAKFVTEPEYPEPEYRTKVFMVYATIKNKKFLEINSGNVMGNTQDNNQDKTQERILEYCKVPRSKGEIAEFWGYKDVKSFGKNHFKALLASHRLLMTIPDKPTSKNQKYITK